MTESMDRESSSHLTLGDGVAEALRQAGKLDSTTVITHCVTVVQTFTEDENGKRYDIHRIYPYGELDPSTERGILADAIEDSRTQRRRRTAS
jgi:hypothetical protein